MTTKKALVVVGVLLFLIGASLVVPAKYVGVKKKHSPLILTSGEELLALKGDRNQNSLPDWKDLLVDNMDPSTKAKAEKVVVSETAKARLANPNNLTSSFTKNVYTATAYASKNGTLTVKQQDELASTLIEGEQAKIITKTYEVSDLTIAKSESDASRKAYGNALGKIAKKAMSYKMSEDDLAIIKAYNVNKDETVLDSLVVKKNNLELVIKDLLATPVPNSAVPYHLLIVNRISQYKDTLDNMSQAKEDPVRAAIALNSYASAVNSLISSFASMQTYLTLEGITFTKKDPGYVLAGGASLP